MPDSIACYVVVTFKIREKVRVVSISVRIGFFSDYCCRKLRSLKYGQSFVEFIIDQSVRLSKEASEKQMKNFSCI